MVDKSRASLPLLVKESLVLSAEGAATPNTQDKEVRHKEGLSGNWLNKHKLGLELQVFPK